MKFVYLYCLKTVEEGLWGTTVDGTSEYSNCNLNKGSQLLGAIIVSLVTEEYR